jgi:S-adenosyl-L-methionine hydrolase (adenosine-forming)
VPIITLTTDFGRQDWFVGAMKGVILRLNPRATIADLSHEVPAGDIRSGAFVLAAGCCYFPKGTVHVAVVDPGVGSARSAIAVRTADYFFVGPDNGVLSLALAREKVLSIRRLTEERFFLRPVSRTFHGRDVFAPVAAHLSRGVSARKLGPAEEDFVRLPWRESRTRSGCVEGEIIYVDRFGNAITNITTASLPAREKYGVFVGRKRVGPVREFYQSVPIGETVAVPGSAGFLEICVNGGSAAKKLKLRIGSGVSLRWR